jgi:hypothetical protein
MTPCSHDKLGESVRSDMGSFPASWMCEECKTNVPITWTPTWPVKQKPSEWIRERTEQLIAEHGNPQMDDAHLAALTTVCSMKAITDYLDAHAR